MLTENNKILANVFLQTLTNQARLNACTVLHTYITELNIVHDLIAQCNRTSHYTRVTDCRHAACNRVLIINYYTSRLCEGLVKNIPTTRPGAKWSRSPPPPTSVSEYTSYIINLIAINSINEFFPFFYKN
jgi:hypothetical protein